MLGILYRNINLWSIFLCHIHKTDGMFSLKGYQTGNIYKVIVHKAAHSTMEFLPPSVFLCSIETAEQRSKLSSWFYSSATSVQLYSLVTHFWSFVNILVFNFHSCICTAVQSFEIAANITIRVFFQVMFIMQLLLLEKNSLT